MNRDHPSVRALICAIVPVLAACQAETPLPQAARPVHVIDVQPVSGNDARVLSGTLKARVESELSFQAGGRLLERRVDLGSRVRRGDLLARLDARDYRLAEQAARENVRAAEAEARQSALDAARFERLLAEGSVGAADTERQKSRAEAAAARLAAAGVARELAGNRVGHTGLIAPFDGVVVALRAETGQVLEEGQPVLVLARTDEIEVKLDVPEALIAGLPDLVATARLHDAPGQPGIPLRLRERAAQADDPARTYRVRYAIAAVPADWLLGRSVEVDLTRPAPRVTFELPVSAVMNTGGRTWVWKLSPEQERLLPQDVEIVAQRTSAVRVTGLAAGDRVVGTGAHLLDSGVRVRPVDASRLNVATGVVR